WLYYTVSPILSQIKGLQLLPVNVYLYMFEEYITIENRRDTSSKNPLNEKYRKNLITAKNGGKIMSWTWMLILIGLIIIACVVAAIITVRISKQMERKQEKYDEMGETYEDELERSHEYEVQSLKS